MSDSFVPDSFTPDTDASIEKKKPVKDSFEADSFTPDTETEAQKDLKENEGLVGYLGSQKYTSDKEIEDIARKTGADPAVLKEAAPLLGVAPEKGMSLKEAAGSAGVGVANAASFGLLRKYIREQGGTPENIKGLEALQELAEARRGGVTKASELLTQVPIGIGRGVKAIGNLGRGALEGAAIGAAAGAGSSKSGEGLQDAAKGAALGGVLGAAVPAVIAGGSKAIKGLRKKQTEYAAEQLEKEGFNLQDEANKMLEANKESDEALRNTVLKGEPISSPEKAQSVLGSDVTIPKEKLIEEAEQKGVKALRDFEEFLTGDKSKEVPESVASIKDYLARNYGSNEAAINAKYNEFINDKATRQAIDDLVLRSGDKDGLRWITQKNLGGGQWAQQEIDDLAGTSIRKEFRNLSQAGQKQAFVAQAVRDKADSMFGDSLRSLSEEQVKAVNRALDTGDISKIQSDRAMLDSYNGIKLFLSDFRNLNNGKTIPGARGNQVIKLHEGVRPLGIPDIGNYTPHSVVKGREFETRVNDKIQAVLGDRYKSLRDMDQAGISLKNAAESNKDVKDLVDTLSMYRENPPTRFADLENQLKDLVEKQGNIPLKPKARAAMERNEGIPDYLLNENLRETLPAYINNTLSTVYQRAPVENLERQANYLKKLGMDSGADYVEKHIQDVRGLRSGTFASGVSKLANKMESAMDFRARQVGYNTPKGLTYRLAASIPSLINASGGNVYGSVLGGFKLKPVITNLTQSISTTAPGLGGTYGYKVVARSLLKSQMNRKALLKRAAELGAVGPDRSQALRDAFASGIEASKAFRGSKFLLNKATEIGMTLFKYSEEFNRTLTFQVADNVIKDVTRGNLKGLAKLPANTRRQIDDLLAKGDIQGASDYLGVYLNSSTQFVYDKASMSAVGRYMGPLFAQFTKWPTETAGEILYIMGTSKPLTGKTKRLVERFVIPYAILTVSDNLIREGFDLEDSDRYDQLVGKGGLGQSAQITSVAGLVNKNASEVFTPPIAKAGGEVVSAVANSEPEDMLETGLNTLARAGKIFLPGSVAAYYRLFAEDIPTWVSGERPPKD